MKDRPGPQRGRQGRKTAPGAEGRGVGLALGGGSARGWAHIGVLEAMDEAGMEVDFIAGTSMGALVGAVYASGGLAELKKVAMGLDWRQILGFFDIVFPSSGLIDGKKVADFIRSHVKASKIEELDIPFAAVSTDLVSGKEVVLRSGDLIEAIRASISIPGIFTPVRHGSMVLADGGIVNPVPVSAVREMGAGYIIAVDPMPGGAGRGGERRAARTPPASDAPTRPAILVELEKRLGRLNIRAVDQIRRWLSDEGTPNIFDVLVDSIYIMERQICETRLRLDRPDLVIAPKVDVGFLEFSRAAHAIAQGYREASYFLFGKKESKQRKTD
ncbi:MAG TPA: patatin [Deltaproteobacteria bacterium]|nr:patatin [Deltaproteobacteria bacterium]